MSTFGNKKRGEEQGSVKAVHRHHRPPLRVPLVGQPPTDTFPRFLARLTEYKIGPNCFEDFLLSHGQIKLIDPLSFGPIRTNGFEPVRFVDLG